jgi:hypothetical protein
MTVSTTANRADYQGNGATTSFAVPFYFPDPTNLLVLSTVVSTGASTPLVLNSDYTVSGAGASAGGTVTTSVAVPTGSKLSILLNLSYTQGTHYVENDPFHAATIEANVDYLTLLAKQTGEVAGRSLQVPIGESGTAVTLPSAPQRAGMLLGFDSFGAPALITAVAQSATAVALQLTGFVSNLAASTGAALVGFLQSGTGAISRTLQSKGRDTIHLFDFMSAAQIADVQAGTLTLDGSASLALAIASLPTAGGTIRLPRGKVLLNSVVTLSGVGHIRLVGEGFAEAANNVGATELIKAATLTSAAIVVNSPGVRLENFVLRGAVGNTGDGVQVSANSATLDSVSVFAMGQDGVRIGLDAGTNANSWHTVNCRFFNNGRYGLNVSDSVYPTLPNASAGTWLNCVSQGNTNDGIRVGNATLNAFLGGVLENNGGCGIRFNGQGCNYNSVIGVDFDSGNAAGKMRIETGAVYNRVDAATLFDSEIVDNGTLSQLNLPSNSNAGWYSKGIFRMQLGNPGGPSDVISGAGGGYTRFGYGGDASGGALTDATAQIVVASNGLHLGKSTSGLVGFFDATPVAKQTTAVGSSSTVANSGTAVNLATTFDGYTLQQIVKALRNYGLLQ